MMYIDISLSFKVNCHEITITVDPVVISKGQGQPEMSKVDSSDPTVKISLPWKWRPLKRRMLPGCELFIDGDSAMHLARKLIPLEDDSSSKDDIDKIM